MHRARSLASFASASTLLILAASCGGSGAEPVSSPPPSGPDMGTAAPVMPTPSASATAPVPAPEPKKPMNVIAIFVDSLRADRMPWEGYDREVAPNIAAFAEEAVNFTNFHSVSSQTAMSFGAFVGARYPGELQRSGYFFSAYPDEETMFPELLQAAGVRTMAGHAHWYFSTEKAGFHQGFDDYRLIDGLKKSNTTDENVTSPAHLALAKQQLGDPKNTGGQFFAWYHFMDPHDQYVLHEGGPDFGKTKMSDRYDGEVHFTDRHVGELLDFIEAQPWADHTAVIISADHGEAFGEHDHYRHGFELWNVLVDVPLLIRVPGIAPRVVDVPRGGIDLPLTILDLMGVEGDPSFQGVSLVPEMKGEAAPPRPVVLDLPRTSDNDRRRAVIDGGYKLIAYGDDDAFKLFDLEKDPGENKDIRWKDEAAFNRMRELYRSISGEIRDVCPKIKKLKNKKPNKPC